MRFTCVWQHTAYTKASYSPCRFRSQATTLPRLRSCAINSRTLAFAKQYCRAGIAKCNTVAASKTSLNVPAETPVEGRKLTVHYTRRDKDVQVRISHQQQFLVLITQREKRANCLDVL